jgi:hypothetical protein
VERSDFCTLITINKTEEKERKIHREKKEQEKGLGGGGMEPVLRNGQLE